MRHKGLCKNMISGHAHARKVFYNFPATAFSRGWVDNKLIDLFHHVLLSFLPQLIKAGVIVVPMHHPGCDWHKACGSSIA